MRFDWPRLRSSHRVHCHEGSHFSPKKFTRFSSTLAPAPADQIPFHVAHTPFFHPLAVRLALAHRHFTHTRRLPLPFRRLCKQPFPPCGCVAGFVANSSPRPKSVLPHHQARLAAAPQFHSPAVASFATQFFPAPFHRLKRAIQPPVSDTLTCMSWRKLLCCPRMKRIAQRNGPVPIVVFPFTHSRWSAQFSCKGVIQRGGRSRCRTKSLQRWRTA